MINWKDDIWSVKPSTKKLRSAGHCDRCNQRLWAWITSWFTTETICLDCCAEENRIKQRLRNRGEDPDEYEGCGYVPRE
jgi:hypothetical protein